MSDKDNYGVLKGSMFTQARRWSTQQKRGDSDRVSLRDMTPEEAQVCLSAALLQHGMALETMLEYDRRADMFRTRCRDTEGKRHAVDVPAETVAAYVHALRTVAGSNGPMKHPSEVRAELLANHGDANHQQGGPLIVPALRRLVGL